MKNSPEQIASSVSKSLDYLYKNRRKHQPQFYYCLNLPVGSKRPRMRKTIRRTVAYNIMRHRVYAALDEAYKPMKYTVVCDKTNNPEPGYSLTVDIYIDK